MTIIHNGSSLPLCFRNDYTETTVECGYDITKNVCELFGPAGYIRTSYSYAPFGAVSASGDVSQPFQWSSEHYDSELDLVYYNYRHYSPTLGRFLSRDPIEEQGGRNLYAFVKNTPIRKRDILGRSMIAPGAEVWHPINPEKPTPAGLNCVEKIGHFMSWYAQEKAKLDDRDENGKNWIECLPKCPEQLKKKESVLATPVGDGCFYIEVRVLFVSPDENEWLLTNGYKFEITQIYGSFSCGVRYHPKGEFELRTKDPSKYDGHGNQCIYDSNGALMREIPSAGSVDWASPEGDVGLHRTADVFPFEDAVALDRVCGGNGKYVRMYYEVRPSR